MLSSFDHKIKRIMKNHHRGRKRNCRLRVANYLTLFSVRTSLPSLRRLHSHRVIEIQFQSDFLFVKGINWTRHDERLKEALGGFFTRVEWQIR